MNNIKTLLVMVSVGILTVLGMMFTNTIPGVSNTAFAGKVKTIHKSHFEWQGLLFPMGRYETNLRFKGKNAGKKHYKIKKLTFDGDYKNVKWLELSILNRSGTVAKSTRKYNISKSSIRVNYKVAKGTYVYMTLRVDLPNAPDKNITKKERL